MINNKRLESMLQRRVTDKMVKLNASTPKGVPLVPAVANVGCYNAYSTRKLHLWVEKPCKQDNKLAEGCLEGPKTRDYFLKQHLRRRNNTAKQMRRCCDVRPGGII